MSLTSINYDASAIRQATADSRNVYGYIANPVANYRPYPGPQPVGISVDRLGSAQSQVDLESMLRNQSFVPSKNAQLRADADAPLQQMFDQQNQEKLKNMPCVSTSLTPQTFYLHRACDPLAGLYIDRFDILQYPTQGFMYSATPAQYGENTVNQALDEIARNRPKQ